MTSAYGVGHGTTTCAELLARLAPGGVRRVVDIRTVPASRRHPQHGREELARWLPEAGVEYRWEPRLGGFRRPAPDSPDTVWRNESFRGYAGHLRTDEARSAIADLIADVRAAPTAFLCSETVWWRCHRRLVADVLVLVEGLAVGHLMGGPPVPHRPTDGARRAGTDLVYDGTVPGSTG